MPQKSAEEIIQPQDWAPVVQDRVSFHLDEEERKTGVYNQEVMLPKAHEWELNARPSLIEVRKLEALDWDIELQDEERKEP